MDDRSYPTHPIPGVGALVVGRKGLLLVRRDKPPHKGLWSIPGGGVEVGETQHQALIREVQEETGVLVDPLELVSTADMIREDEDGQTKFHFLLNHYLCLAKTEETRPEYPWAEVDWFPLDDLPSDETTPDILELVESVRSRIIEIKKRIDESTA